MALLAFSHAAVFEGMISAKKDTAMLIDASDYRFSTTYKSDLNEVLVDELR